MKPRVRPRRRPDLDGRRIKDIFGPDRVEVLNNIELNVTADFEKSIRSGNRQSVFEIVGLIEIVSRREVSLRVRIGERLRNGEVVGRRRSTIRWRLAEDFRF